MTLPARQTVFIACVSRKAEGTEEKRREKG